MTGKYASSGSFTHLIMKQRRIWPCATYFYVNVCTYADEYLGLTSTTSTDFSPFMHGRWISRICEINRSSLSVTCCADLIKNVNGQSGGGNGDLFTLLLHTHLPRSSMLCPYRDPGLSSSVVSHPLASLRNRRSPTQRCLPSL
jgi:hypothetical protein